MGAKTILNLGERVWFPETLDFPGRLKQGNKDQVQVRHQFFCHGPKSGIGPDFLRSGPGSSKPVPMPPLLGASFPKFHQKYPPLFNFWAQGEEGPVPFLLLPCTESPWILAWAWQVLGPYDGMIRVVNLRSRGTGKFSNMFGFFWVIDS